MGVKRKENLTEYADSSEVGVGVWSVVRVRVREYADTSEVGPCECWCGQCVCV